MRKQKKAGLARIPGERHSGGAKVHEPQQARSRETMRRILNALEALLAEKPFDRITMLELAQASGTGISSIYARFSDKQALILSLHGLIRDEVVTCIEDLTVAARWEGKSVEDIVGKTIPAVLLFYKKHESLMRAALFIDERLVKDRQATVLHLVSERFTALFATRSPRNVKAIGRAVDASTRIVASVMYSSIIFGDVQLVRAPVTDRELARQLSYTVVGLINEAEKSGPGN